jgi:hypothetical protein
VCSIVKRHWADLLSVLQLGDSSIVMQDETNTTVISSAFSLSKTVSKAENNKGKSPIGADQTIFPNIILTTNVCAFSSIAYAVRHGRAAQSSADSAFRERGTEVAESFTIR